MDFTFDCDPYGTDPGDPLILYHIFGLDACLIWYRIEACDDSVPFDSSVNRPWMVQNLRMIKFCPTPARSDRRIHGTESLDYSKLSLGDAFHLKAHGKCKRRGAFRTPRLPYFILCLFHTRFYSAQADFLLLNAAITQMPIPTDWCSLYSGRCLLRLMDSWISSYMTAGVFPG